jgi:phosphoglycerate dehydrogenase-like enzyme
MSYKFVFLPPVSERTRTFSAPILAAVPDLEIVYCEHRQEALAALPGARACFGTLDAELLAAAADLQWLAAPAAGPAKGYYFPELIASDVAVTNFRGIFNDHISAHIMAFVLVLSRGMHRYFRDQFASTWRKGGEASPSTYLPESTALIIGVGGIGAETARQCKNWGMKTVGVDPRVASPPDGVDELHRPDALNSLLPTADFAILTAPQTPNTEGLFTSARFEQMKDSAYFINIGRGSNVKLLDLDQALREGQIAGAALDVFAEEPLPEGHPLWTAPNFLMTPHVAASGPYLEDRRRDLLVENCKRFAEGEELVNIVDKENWF